MRSFLLVDLRAQKDWRSLTLEWMFQMGAWNSYKVFSEKDLNIVGTVHHRRRKIPSVIQGLRTRNFLRLTLCDGGGYLDSLSQRDRSWRTSPVPLATAHRASSATKTGSQWLRSSISLVRGLGHHHRQERFRGQRGQRRVQEGSAQVLSGRFQRLC